MVFSLKRTIDVPVCSLMGIEGSKNVFPYPSTHIVQFLPPLIPKCDLIRGGKNLASEAKIFRRLRRAELI